MSALPILEPVRRRLRELPPGWVDAALVVLVVAVQGWPFGSRINPSGAPWHWWGYAVVAASAVPLLWRRRAPVAVLVASLTATACYDLFGDVPAQPIWYGGLVAIYTVAERSRHLPRVAMLIVTVGGSLAITSSETALRSGVLFIAAYAIGRAATTSRAYTAALRQRAAQIERERGIEMQRAAERERARIARDMHDILSHAVAVMVVQAEAGPVMLHTAPERAEAAFDAISTAGRDAMVQLRRILDVLKEDDGPRSPQPTIDDLAVLAAKASGPALTVTCTATGEQRPLRPDVEVAAYRIVQEAVTNVVKHAGAGRADIRLLWQERTLIIEINDDGRGAGRSLPSGGDGLVGIRERAAACGGTAAMGPRPDGPGFQVHVQLPLAVRQVWG
ncbi:sensor histidine kinase [Actinoplanes sp. NEAU-A12]|uniref:histidine kinase n=1 Tax=Actinoplanes sandaracinus TaxID=3045177 RepID=A0ABT6WWA8_9ACTN|nr:sensor histidine kinase [Actinoplanes sandaracinus]MDI6104038.1 sensor histidine kinase [Actinoplanes sandaracinus]